VKRDAVVSIQQPTSPKDALTEVLREGAQKLLAEAIKAEVENFLDQYQELRDEHGRQRVVRNGHLPEREIQTGLGGIKVRVPRTRDRSSGTRPEEVIRFRSSLVPPYLRRSKSVEELLPLLYLKGISTGDFSEALSGLLGQMLRAFQRRQLADSSNSGSRITRSGDNEISLKNGMSIGGLTEFTATFVSMMLGSVY